MQPHAPRFSGMVVRPTRFAALRSCSSLPCISLTAPLLARCRACVQAGGYAEHLHGFVRPAVEQVRAHPGREHCGVRACSVQAAAQGIAAAAERSAEHRMQQQCLHAAHRWVACSLACSLHPRSTLDRCGCRADGSVDRLTYFEIRVGDTPATDDPTANALCASYDSPAQSVYTFACSSPTPGRYLVVRLRPVDYSLRTDTILTLCEVQAYGAAPPPPPR